MSAPSVLAEEPVRLGTMPFNTMVYQSTITNDLVTAIRGVSNSIPDVSSFVDKSVTNGLASQSWVTDKKYVTESITNGLATAASLSGYRKTGDYIDLSGSGAAGPTIEAAHGPDEIDFYMNSSNTVARLVSGGIIMTSDYLDIMKLATTNDVLDTKKWVSTNYLSVAFWNSSLAPTLQGMIDRKASTNDLVAVSNLLELTRSDLSTTGDFLSETASSLSNVSNSVVSLSSSLSNVSNSVESIAGSYRKLSDNAFPQVVVTNEQPSVSLLCTTNLQQLSILTDQVLVKTNALDPSSRYALKFPSAGGTFGRIEDVDSATKFVVERPHYLETQEYIVTPGANVDVSGGTITVFDGTVPASGTLDRNFVVSPSGNEGIAKVDLQCEIGKGVSFSQRYEDGSCTVSVTSHYDGLIITNLPVFTVTNMVVYKYEDDFREQEYDLTMGDVKLVDSEGSVKMSELRKWTKDTYDPVTRGHWSEFDALSDVQLDSHDLYFTNDKEIFFRSDRSVEEDRDILTLYGKTVPVMEVRAPGEVVTNRVLEAGVRSLAVDDPEFSILSFTLSGGTGTIVVNDVGADEYTVLSSSSPNGTFAAAKDVKYTKIPGETNTVELVFPAGSCDQAFFKAQAIFNPVFAVNENVFTGAKMMRSKPVVIEGETRTLETETVTYPAVVNFGVPVYVMKDQVVTYSTLTNMLTSLATEGITIDGHTYRLVEVVR